MCTIHRDSHSKLAFDHLRAPSFLPALYGINSYVSTRIAGPIIERTTRYKENEENEITTAGQKTEEEEREEEE